MSEKYELFIKINSYFPTQKIEIRNEFKIGLSQIFISAIKDQRIKSVTYIIFLDRISLIIMIKKMKSLFPINFENFQKLICWHDMP